MAERKEEEGGRSRGDPRAPGTSSIGSGDELRPSNHLACRRGCSGWPAVQEDEAPVCVGCLGCGEGGWLGRV